VSQRKDLHRWREFISKVEAGYPALGLDDYFNGLSVRDAIERELPPMAGRELVSELHVLDERFRDCTRPVTKTFLQGDKWWHWRVPLHADPDLAEELESLGFGTAPK
jgi:hypothetical protein